VENHGFEYWTGGIFLLVDAKIEQVPKFNYLGAEITAKQDLKQEVRTQATGTARISGFSITLYG
jgi:hypothetical protein